MNLECSLARLKFQNWPFEEHCFQSRIHRKWRCSSAKNLSVWPFLSSHFLVFWDKLCWHFVWRVMHINLIISYIAIHLVVFISISTESDNGLTFHPIHKLTAWIRRNSIISEANTLCIWYIVSKSVFLTARTLFSAHMNLGWNYFKKIKIQIEIFTCTKYHLPFFFFSLVCAAKLIKCFSTAKKYKLCKHV